MDNDVTITDAQGNVTVISQDNIVSPKFDCNGCYTGAEYVARIAEYGVTTVTNNVDGTFTYNKISPHCICNIEFTITC